MVNVVEVDGVELDIVDDVVDVVVNVVGSCCVVALIIVNVVVDNVMIPAVFDCSFIAKLVTAAVVASDVVDDEASAFSAAVRDVGAGVAGVVVIVAVSVDINHTNIKYNQNLLIPPFSFLLTGRTLTKKIS